MRLASRRRLVWRRLPRNWSTTCNPSSCKRAQQRFRWRSLAWMHGVSRLVWQSFTSFPQQHKLMRSSAQNSPGVHWCRRRVRFNKVLEKGLKVPEKVREALVQSQVRFNRVRKKVPEKVQSQVRFNRVPEKAPEKVPEKVQCKARSGSTGFRRRFRRRFRRLWCRARSGSTAFRKSGQVPGFRRLFRRRFRRRSRLWCRARSGWEALAETIAFD